MRIKHFFHQLFVSTSVKWRQSLLTFFAFYGTVGVLRLILNSGTADLIKQQGYIILSALCLTLVLNVWNFCKKIFVWFAVFWLLYCSVLLIKKEDGMVLLDREIIHTISFATFICGLILFLRFLVPFSKIFNFSYILLVFGLASPLLVAGYAVVSGGHMLSADILLTLFQTNVSEIRSYLEGQNIWLWIISVLSLFLLIVIGIYALKRTELYTCLNNQKAKRRTIIITGVFYAYIIFFVLPKLTSCFVLSLTDTVTQTLRSFKIYEQTSQLRAQRLSKLKNVLKQNTNDGIYVLVVGESTARDHMHAFGYKRPNTPWLSLTAEKPNTLLFQNAYSNHVHTVPAVQYALSELNQYQNVSIEDAYSIVEVAKAIGFETYWISNQKQFNVSDTPLTTIAASANYQIWLNSYAGNKTMTTYYDEKLPENLPDLTKSKKTFIVLHLMGCHSVYKERYPAEYDIFNDKTSRIDEYDNAILYNDFVLGKIYNKIKDNPNFMAFVYFSDHGEDPDNGFTHEASKFTYPMSRIPLVMIFSDKFMHKNSDIFETLKKNVNKPVTSDLIYNTMLSLLGVNGMPGADPKLDISSAQYGMNAENLLTVHGQRRIFQDVKLLLD